MADFSVNVHLNNGIVNRILGNNKVGLFTAETCARYMVPYVPMESGTLSQNYTTEPWKVIYNQPYAHYQYTGQAYGPSFPISQGGATVGFFSKPGEKKHPTGKPLKYSKGQHPLATSKWDVAMKNAKIGQVANEISNYLRRM